MEAALETTDLCDLLRPLAPLAPAMGGEEILPGLFHAFASFGAADVYLKRRRKAKLVRAASVKDWERMARAHNSVGIRRLERALAHFSEAVDAHRTWRKEDVDRATRRDWPRIVREEILPDVQDRLLNSPLTVGELELFVDPNANILSPRWWSFAQLDRQFASLPKTLAPFLRDRRRLQKARPIQLDRMPLASVSWVHAVLILVTKIVVSIAIEVCKMWNLIVSWIIDIIWRFVEGFVYEQIIEWTRDGKVEA